MKRLILVALLAALAGAIIGILFPSTVIAEDRRWLRGSAGFDGPPPAPLAQQARLSDTGVWEWQYRQDPGAPSLRAAIEQAHVEYDAEFGVPFVEVSGGNIEWARTSAIFQYGDGITAGCPGAVGCLPRYGLDLTVWYDAGIMAAYTFRGQVSVVLHEDCHAIADCGEMYIHTGGRLLCSGKPWTTMDCGLGHANFLQDFDRETVRRYIDPPPVAGAALSQANPQFVWYAKTNNRATRAAVWFRTYTGFTYWSGAYVPVCTADGIVCGGATIPDPGQCQEILLGPENARYGTWGRNLVSAGWSAGC
jgi:hypothetical protein